MILDNNTKDDSVDDVQLNIVEDVEDDVLIECYGGCGKKILFFKPSAPEEDEAGLFCIDCLSKMISRDVS